MEQKNPMVMIMNRKSNCDTMDVVVGMGEIGIPISTLISKITPVFCYDKKPDLCKKLRIKKNRNLETLFLHICIPFTANFSKDVISLKDKFSPKYIIIHSTVSPNTTKTLQKELDIPIIFSAIRGIHQRMLKDLKRYTKFFAIENDAPNKKLAISEFRSLFKKCNIQTKQLSNTVTLELAKIVVDTSYYGWLINYAQLSNVIAKNFGVNYDEMWSFSDEIQKFLKNRPKMFPGIIGGHCVIPNITLIDDPNLKIIEMINSDYEKFLINN